MTALRVQHVTPVPVARLSQPLVLSLLICVTAVGRPRTGQGLCAPTVQLARIRMYRELLCVGPALLVNTREQEPTRAPTALLAPTRTRLASLLLLHVRPAPLAPTRG